MTGEVCKHCGREEDAHYHKHGEIGSCANWTPIPLTERDERGHYIVSPLSIGSVITGALQCWRCGTAAYQPNDRCDSHISWKDRLDTEITMHAAWRKRANEAEAREATDPRPPAAAVDLRTVSDEQLLEAIAEAMNEWSTCAVCGWPDDDDHGLLPHAYEGRTDASVVAVFRAALAAPREET